MSLVVGLSGGLGLGAKGRGGLAPLTSAFIARGVAAGGSPLSPTLRSAYDGVIKAFLGRGLNAKLDYFHIWRTHEIAYGFQNLMQPSFVAAFAAANVFTADVGIVGQNSTANYVDEGFNPTTATSPHFQQDDNAFGGGVVAGTKAALDQTMMGNGSNMQLYPYFSDGNGYWRDAIGSDVIFTPPASLVGHYASIRSGPTSSVLRKDGANIATSALASSALLNRNFQALSETVGGKSSLTLSYTWAGGNGITAGDADFIATTMTSFFP